MTTRDQIVGLLTHLNQCIVGQSDLTARLIIALLADGHLLVEGAPGLAKTKAIKTLAAGIDGDFHRIQFTPDLLPADLTGTDIYRPQDGSFQFQQGPIFHNLVLADEINRAPAKVQSALLEAMGERQITVGQKTYKLPDLFLVMATQNPIEQEGTYPLPEAQLDRFLMYVRVDYPDPGSEQQILEIARREARAEISQTDVAHAPVPVSTINQARSEVLDIHLAPALEDYIIKLVTASRSTKTGSGNIEQWIRYGASPRATIAIDRCARAHAWLNDRDFVTPEDIHQIVYDVMRHRLLLSFEAEADGISPDRVIDELLAIIPVP